jgi:hypothetical protein
MDGSQWSHRRKEIFKKSSLEMSVNLNMKGPSRPDFQIVTHTDFPRHLQRTAATNQRIFRDLKGKGDMLSSKKVPKTSSVEHLSFNQRREVDPCSPT